MAMDVQENTPAHREYNVDQKHYHVEPKERELIGREVAVRIHPGHVPSNFDTRHSRARAVNDVVIIPSALVKKMLRREPYTTISVVEIDFLMVHA